MKKKLVTSTKKQPMPERRLLRTNAAAAYIGLSEKRVRQFALDGEIPFIKLPGLRTPYLFDVRDLDRWIEQNRMAGVAS